MPKKILLFILLTSIGAAAQLQRYDNYAATTASASGIGNLTQIIPNATLQVFLYPGVGVNCAGGGCTAATTYTSRTGLTTCGAGVPLTRPTANVCLSTADAQGNFGFWANAGNYQYCVVTTFGTQCFNVVLSAPLDFAIAGVFTNTQMNLNIESLLNGCTPASEYHFYSGASANETEAITGCTTTPVGSPTNLQNVAVNGYAVQQSASTPTIAVQGLARATGTGLASATAGTFVISDGGTGNPATNLFAVQPFVQLNNTTSGGVGLLVGGALRAQPTGANPMTAMEIAKPIANAGGPYTWVKGVRFDQGATLEPTITNLTNGFVGIEFNPVASGNTQPSQGFCFIGTTSGGGGAFACNEALATGDEAITTNQPGTGLKINGNPATQTIASGTAAMTTAAIGAGACGTTVTVSATGAATTDTIAWSFNAAPAGTNAGIVGWPTTNNVNFAYCPGVAETPAAATINWRVVR